MIRRLQVKNFKSIRELDLELGLVNVLVGPNMAGKSNLVDVFRFLTNMMLPPAGTHGLSHAVQTGGGFWELAWKGSESNLISLRLQGELSGTEWDYAISIVADQRGYDLRVQDEFLTFVKDGKRSDLIKTEGDVRKMLRPDGQILTQVNQVGRSALEYEIPDWEGNLLRLLFSFIQFHRPFPPLMKLINQMQGQRFLQEHGNNLSSWLMTIQTTHRESFVRIEAIMRDAFPHLESVFTVPTQQSTVFLSSKEKFLRRAVTCAQMSDGELAFLAFLSLILSPDELGASLHCLEEPENHLHPKLLEILVEILRQEHEARSPDNRGQVIVTTHSPYLVDQFKLEELLVVEKREGATDCTRPKNKDHLRELLERREVGLGDLFYSGALSGAR
jgi:predicted ATPase